MFIIDWLLHTGMQRRANVVLNKGVAHRGLKNALCIGRQGRTCNKTTERQHYRMAGLNLLTAIIIYWNTKQLGHSASVRKRVDLDC